MENAPTSAAKEIPGHQQYKQPQAQQSSPNASAFLPKTQICIYIQHLQISMKLRKHNFTRISLQHLKSLWFINLVRKVIV